MRLRCKVHILILILCVALAGGAEVVSASSADRAATLQRLRVSKTPQKDAVAAAKANPRQAAALCLDLIFYDWINTEMGADPDIPHLIEIVQGLATEATPAVDWARVYLALPEMKYGRPDHAPQRGELIDPLKDARAALLQAAARRDISPVSAVSGLNTAYDILNRLDLELSSAAVLRERGNQRLVMGHYRLSESDYEQGWMVFTSYGCDVKVAEVLGDLGSLNMRLSRYTEAHRKFLAAGHKWLAGDDGRKACRQFIRAGQALAAMGRQEEALSAIMFGYEGGRHWAVAEKSYVWLIEDLIEMGRIAMEWEAWADARDFLIDADKWAKLSGDTRVRSQVLDLLARAWIEAGKQTRPEQLATSQEKAEECLRIREDLLNSDVTPGTAALVRLASGASVPVAERGEVLATLNRGAWALEELGRYSRAAVMHEQVGALYKNLGMRSDRVQALWSAAAAYQKSDDNGRALDLRLKAAVAAQTAGMKSIAAQILVEVAEAYSSSDVNAALKTLREASLLAQDAGVWREYALIQRTRAGLLKERREYAEAELHLAVATQRYIAYVGDPWEYADMCFELAEIYRMMEKTDKELSTLTDAATRLQTWCEYEGINPSDNERRSEILAALYSKLIPLQLAAGDAESAVDHLRRAVRQGWLRLVSQEILASDNQEAIALIERLSREEREPTIADVSNRLVAQGWPAVLQLSWQLAESFPRFSRSVIIDVAKIYKHRERLPEDLAVVEYLIGDSIIYTFVLGRNEAYCRQINLENIQIDSEIRVLRNILIEDEKWVSAGMPLPPVESWRLTDVDGNESNLPIVVDALKTLGEVFIAPIREDLDFASQIAFAPPTEMSGVPFHAFAWKSEGSVRFLIQDVAVSYITSMMFADLIRPGGRLVTRPQRVAIFADPLQSLQGAAEEAEAIRRFYPDADVFVGRAATKEQFRKMADSASILHIAAHYRPNANPAKFSIEFASGLGGPGTIGIEDLFEIANPGLTMVVLSACETAGSANPMLTSTAQAAEILSLTGAPTVVGALWKVSDKGSTRLMGEMYRELWEGTSKAEALRKAQIAMITTGKREFAHPYYWAGFALFGNPD